MGKIFFKDAPTLYELSKFRKMQSGNYFDSYSAPENNDKLASDPLEEIRIVRIGRRATYEETQASELDNEGYVVCDVIECELPPRTSVWAIQCAGYAASSVASVLYSTAGY